MLHARLAFTILIIRLCILLRVYQLNIGITSLCNKVFLVLDFIVHFSHYTLRTRLAAIFRRGRNTKHIYGSHYINNFLLIFLYLFMLFARLAFTVLIIGLCILLRVYQLIIGITSVSNKVFFWC
jgi:hypothetical protein